ncbi:Lipid-A-disaccharide synthase [hydrothermal vent metagenome]|uniref:lipid-A-disaccharide synthase n=1 Tax=hydrothermal vent metagenome TaxID=652676 RepID=A0A3B1A0X0_9ZZZZ
MIIAGEASGDLHGAQLIRQVTKLDSQVTFFGIGGSNMRSAGVDIKIDASKLAVIGLVEVIKHYRQLVSYLDDMKALLKSQRPDLLILIDYPGFNLRLAKAAKLLKIKVLFYISPQVWAWRKGRVKKIGQSIDMMAVIFDFETKFYEDYNIPVRFVGHPLTDEIPEHYNKIDTINSLNLDSNNKILGLFPGSRKSEIKNLLPILLESASRLHKQDKNLQFLIPLASTITQEDIAPFLNGIEIPITIIDNNSTAAIQACSAIITASGTVTLEIALSGVPMVVIYKIASMSYYILRMMIHLDHLALCNIVADQRIVPELIQQQANPDEIVNEIEKILYYDNYSASIIEKLKSVRTHLGRSGNGLLVAELALEMLGRR